MKNTIRFGALIIIATASVVACGDDDETAVCETEAQAIAALSDNPSRGQTVFAATCGLSTCHGADGNQGPSPNLSAVAVGRSDTQLATTVNCGIGTMPAQDSLTDQEIADVVAYVQQTFQ